MLLLIRTPQSCSGRGVATAIFGVGLLGASLAGILRQSFGHVEQVAFDWNDRDEQHSQIAEIRRRLEASSDCDGVDRIAIVWAAGKAGFDSMAEEATQELSSFRTVLELAVRLADDAPKKDVAFHMLSSVGGLFEGQRHIDLASVAEPRRPYGELKLAQETALLESSDNVRKHIYRLTSVFGHAAGGARRGLVSTLVENALNQQVTSLVGRLSTLRDFVWSIDAARYVAAELLRPPARQGVSLVTLASGRPSSIYEVVRVVEAVTGRRVYLQCRSRLNNELDITVSPSLLPRGWSATDMRTAVTSLLRGSLAPTGISRHP